MPMMIAMGQGFVQSSIQQNKDMSEEQKKQAGALVDAAGKWAQSVKFTDPTLVKGAIAVICKTARDLNLKSLDEARALDAPVEVFTIDLSADKGDGAFKMSWGTTALSTRFTTK
jgi:hypothetical protein